MVPVSLEIAGRYFPVVPTGLRDGSWAYVTEPGQVSWLAGSTVNVVLGLPYTADNLDLLATTLALSDTLTLRNNVAGTNHYHRRGAPPGGRVCHRGPAPAPGRADPGPARRQRREPRPAIGHLGRPG